MNLLNRIADAGIVGCGGAGFPTDLKYSGGIEHLIINAAECEPLLQTDKFLMRHFADVIIRGICEIKDEFNIPECTIALKADYVHEIAALRQAISARNADVRIHEMESFYPAGDEQTMVYEVTGRIIPPGKIPMSVGAVVDNVGTMLAIGNTIDDTPLCEKYITVGGNVRNPIIVKAPVGTLVSECIAAAGGSLADDYYVVIGGPMMGKYLSKEESSNAVVTKTTSAVLVLAPEDYDGSLDLSKIINRAKSCCIQCSTCTQLCPRHTLGHPLQMHKIMRIVSHNSDLEEILQNSVIQNAALCCECGVCEEYACPMGLAPRKVNSWLKKELGNRHIRPTYEISDLTADPEREYRKVPTGRLIQRLGLSKYITNEINDVITIHPDHIEIPVQMHIGPASIPVVRSGQYVNSGDLVAERADNKKGANIHTGLSGTVISVGDRIIIRG